LSGSSTLSQPQSGLSRIRDAHAHRWKPYTAQTERPTHELLDPQTRSGNESALARPPGKDRSRSGALPAIVYPCRRCAQSLPAAELRVNSRATGAPQADVSVAFPTESTEKGAVAPAL